VKQITQIGATTEEAISLALQKLGVARERVNVEILQEGKKGFLGFGTRPAEIRVTLLEEPPVETESLQDIEEPQQQQVEVIDPLIAVGQYLRSIAVEMGATDTTVEVKEKGKQVYFQMESEKAALIIGKRGQTLNALQQLTQLMLNQEVKQFKTALVDVGNYREKRKESLKQLAERTANKVADTNITYKFEPMPSNERKILHNALAHRLDVETYSEGKEPKRYLVVKKL